MHAFAHFVQQVSFVQGAGTLSVSTNAVVEQKTVNHITVEQVQ